MKKLAVITVLLAGTGAVALTAFGQAGPGRGHGPQMNLEQVDINGDGNISLDEINADRSARFASADANGDGGLTLDEFTSAREAEREARQAERMTKHFERLDADGDGIVTLAEQDAFAAERTEKMFQRVDSNDDGVISEAERDAAKGFRRGHRGKHMQRDG